MKTEQQYSADLMKHLSGDAQRIEPSLTSGIPDISWCCMGIEMWIEAKIYLDTHKGALLRKLQYSWGFRRSINGGHVFVVTFSDMGFFLHKYPFEVTPYGESGRYVILPILTANKKCSTIEELARNIITLSCLPTP
jgi:hypothetical protein